MSPLIRGAVINEASSAKEAQMRARSVWLLEEGAVGFKEAETVLVCRKMYKSIFDLDLFLDPQINCYPEKDFHYIYICEIRSIYTKE